MQQYLCTIVADRCRLAILSAVLIMAGCTTGTGWIENPQFRSCISRCTTHHNACIDRATEAGQLESCKTEELRFCAGRCEKDHEPYVEGAGGTDDAEEARVSPVYSPPLEGEPAAWIKTQYVYTTVRGGTTRLRVSMFIREGQAEELRPAYNQSLGSVSQTADPKVPMHATRIRPVEDTAIRMRLGFEWIGAVTVWRAPLPATDSEGLPKTGEWVREPRTQEAGCSATQQFDPEPDKVYLVYYASPHTMHCTVAIFLETPTGDATFKLEPVGEPYVE